MPMERNNHTEQDQEQYSFLEETIKNDRFDKKKMIYRFSKTVGAGLIIGIAASFSFFALKPWAETVFRKNPDEITIPKDEEKESGTKAEAVTDPVPQTLTLDNYKELNYALRQVVVEAKKSIVQVIGVDETSDLANQTGKNKKEISGVIVADNGQELLILVNDSVVRDVQALKVRFADDTEYDSVLKKKDGNIGMAVLAVPKNNIKETTVSKIKVAKLGNSNAFPQGKTVIALGNPFGYSGGVDYGVASSVDYNVALADGMYNVIVTNMAGTEKSSGVLFDVEGSVVGIIHQDLFDKENSGVLTTYGISSIKSEIELMFNAKDVPYVGIKGTMITKEMSQTEKIPEGLYVTEVEPDSPALKAGIQPGDIIVKIGENKIESFSEYHNVIVGGEVGKQLELKGQRRGTEDYVEIGFTVTVGIKE